MASLRRSSKDVLFEIKMLPFILTYYRHKTSPISNLKTKHLFPNPTISLSINKTTSTQNY